jgi:glucose 1-dehydrogenase
MCANGRYTERGITGIDGYGSTLWTVPARYAVRVDPSLAPVGVLVEPTSVVVKAWERITRFGSGSRVLVTGAGPIGLLAALIGVQRGLDVHVVDRATDGPKPKLVSRLGASYHTSLPAGLAPDVAIEATGAPGLVFPVLESLARNGVLCLTGVPSSEVSSVDVGLMNRNMVLGNQVVFGSVNSNLTHYREAASVLLEADLSWLEGLITRRVPLDGYAAAFSASPDDVKVVIDLARAS